MRLRADWSKGLETTWALAALALGLSACSLQSPLAANAARLKNRGLITAVRRAPPLYAPAGIYGAGAAGGLIGGLAVAAAASDAGDRLVRENHISDPALTIAKELGKSLEQQYGLRSARLVLAAVDDDPTKVGLIDPAADVVLDVWTDRWSMARAGDDPGFSVNYGVNLRLIDAKIVQPIDGRSGAVIAEGTCASDSEGLGGPTQDELLADGARRLKADLDDAAQYCIEDFRSRVLSAKPE